MIETCGNDIRERFREKTMNILIGYLHLCGVVSLHGGKGVHFCNVVVGRHNGANQRLVKRGNLQSKSEY
jgi:hypothetical protein